MNPHHIPTETAAMIINIILSFAFVSILSFSNVFEKFLKNFFSLQGLDDIAVLGLPLAFSLAAILQFILLYLALKRRIKKTS